MKKSAISQRRPEYVLPRIPKFNDITPLGAGGPGTLRAGHCALTLCGRTAALRMSSRPVKGRFGRTRAL